MLLALLFTQVSTATGTRADEPPIQKLAPHDADRRLAEYADCLTAQRNDRARIKVFLRKVPGTKPSQALGNRIASPECLAEQGLNGGILSMTLPQDALRDALYAALYRREFQLSPSANIADVDPLAVSAEFDGDVASAPSGWRVRRALGDCIARGEPVAARQMLLAKPWEPAETTALGPIMGVVAKCLPTGQKLELKRADLRGMVAEAMYKLSVAASVGAKTSAGATK